MPTNEQIAKTSQERLDILVRAGLVMAGFKPADLKRAHKRDVEALDATRTRRSHDKEGNLVCEHVEVDHNVRLLASRAIKQMIPGMYPSQGAGMERDAGSQINVQIVLLQADGTQHMVDVTAHNTQGKLSA